MTTLSPLDPESTDALVEQATQARERLFQSVEALDRKRHQLTKPVVAAEHALVAVTKGVRHPVVFLAGGAITAGAFVGLTLRMIRSGKRRSFWRECGQHAGIGLFALALGEVGKVALEALLAHSSTKDASS